MKCAAETNPDIFLGSIKSLLTLSLSELSFLKNVSTYSKAIKDRAVKNSRIERLLLDQDERDERGSYAWYFPMGQQLLAISLFKFF